MSSSRRARAKRLKQILANILVGILGLVALMLIVGLFLPKEYHVERSIEIRAKPEAVFRDLTALRTWPEWTVWNQQMDPTVKFEFDSPDSGVGAGYRWNGAKLGDGRLKITKADPAKGIEYSLEFQRGQYGSAGSITYEPAGEGLRVTWVNEGSMGKNPIGRYMVMAMDSMLGPDMEGGLSRLKVRAEGGPR